jgi:acyl-homoserine lactone acylase PvdQ
MRSMSSDRVTVSLPASVRQAAQRIAQESGVPFSSVVADALALWLRGRLVDAWLAEHEASFGAFEEAELQALAAEAGVPYLPPATNRSVA